MKKTIKFVALATFLFMTTNAVVAQKADDSEKLSVSLSLNHDAFFGFNPSMALSYPINAKTDFTAYGIMWGAGTASAWGNWTEFGLGVNFKAGAFSINPQVGFTSGSLLSSGTANDGIIGDGIVPNLTVNYDNSKVIGQLYAGYYAAFKNNTKEDGETTLNYTHYWLNTGYKVKSWLALGAHFEHLYLAGGQIKGGGTQTKTDYYQWFGPFVQLNKKNVGMRFSFGKDIDKGEGTSSNSDFYKMAFFVNL
jgi:hypothetical protein